MDELKVSSLLVEDLNGTTESLDSLEDEVVQASRVLTSRSKLSDTLGSLDDEKSVLPGNSNLKDSFDEDSICLVDTLQSHR